MDTSSLVIVGIDFSEPSARAVREARTLAVAMAARLEAVHVSEPLNGPEGEGGVASWEIVPGHAAWLEACGLPTDSVRTRRGTPWVELARDGAERDATVIVVGTHGRGGFQPVSLGSTAARLTMASTRPVLVVGRRGPPTTALVASR